MKVKLLIPVFCFVFIFKVLAILPPLHPEIQNSTKSETSSADSLINGLFKDTITTPKIPSINNKTVVKVNEVDNTTIHKPVETKIVDKPIPAVDSIKTYIIPVKLKLVQVDTLLFKANSFFIELVYKGLPFDFKWDIKPDYLALYYGGKSTTLSDYLLKPIKIQNAEQIVSDLRQYVREQILRNEANLYVMNFDELPDPEVYENHLLEERSYKSMKFLTDDLLFKRRRLIVRREQMGPWQHKAAALLQFSQNYVSPNWYQGGNSNLAILGIVTGSMNYDDKKCIQWENNVEWHIGFNSIAGDSLRSLSTNDDVFKINSKLGVKAGGNWFYSGNVDFSTQFFNSYNGINSTVMVTSFLTPVRLNVGLGMDYKYKKIFSIMFSPVAYKYIYVNDSRNVDPNLFGVQTGEKVLSEIGSSFNSTFSYAFSKEIQVDSKLNFYTNYQSVEVDWEVVCNMVINRFMSTRISFNPRYDTSVILPPGEIARMQMKQLLSVGFSHRFY
jgi:hypothetical protein